MKDNIKIRGRVTVRVFDKDGNIKRHKPTLLNRIFKTKGRLMESKHHNIITTEGDALIADALLRYPNKDKVSVYGHIQVGTGWTGNSTKSNTRCNTPTGSMKALDSNYPQLKASYGNTGDNTVIFRASFAAGELNANSINEACLLNGSSSLANCLAYAQINPAVNVTAADTLQILWEITILGQ